MRKSFRLHIILMLIIGLVGLSACKTEKSASASENKPGAKKELNSKELRNFTVKFMDANRAKILGNTNEAIKLFREALEIDPTSAATLYELARMYANESNFTTALNYAEEAYRIKPENIWFAEFTAKLYSQVGKMDESIAIFREIIKAHPSEYDYYYSLGSLLSAQGKYDEALKIYADLEEKIGTSEDLALQRQMIYIDKGDYNAALLEIDKVIEIHPEEMRLYGMKAEIYEQMGREEDAKTLYEEMLSIEPDNGLVLLSLHDIAKKNGEAEKARDYLLRACASPELSIDVKVNILLNFLNSPYFKKDEDYVISLADAIELAHPDEAKTYAVYGDIYYNLDELDSARVKFRNAVSIDPNRPPIWQQILTIDSQLNDFEALLTESEEALEYFPLQPIFYLFNGIAHLQIKQADEAVEALNTGKNLVVENNKLLAQFYASLGDAYHEQKNHIKSDESYDMALKNDPKNVIVLNNYAYYLSLRKVNLEKAEGMSKKANDLSPNVPSFQDTYGWVLYTRENYQNALFWIEESLKNGGDTDPTVLEHHGDVLLKLNRTQEALESWEKALEAGGEPEDLNPKIEEFQE